MRLAGLRRRQSPVALVEAIRPKASGEESFHLEESETSALRRNRQVDTRRSQLPRNVRVNGGVSPDEMLARREQIVALWLRRRTIRQIAGEVGLSRAMVHRELTEAREEWKSRTSEAYEARLEREIRGIEEIEREAWQAWTRSVGQSITTTEKSAINGMERTVTVRELAGDPRHLSVILQCSAHRARLLGLNAPEDTELDMTAVFRKALERAAEMQPARQAAEGALRPLAEIGLLPGG